MNDPIGQTIGNYRVEALVGTGGMGQVFRARHLHLDRLAAIKVMRPDLSADEGFRARFLREARAAAALRHPNIAEIFDFGEQEGRFYLVMELVVDGSLRTLLQTGIENLPLPHAVDLVRQAADALAFAHAQGMIHRDVKPDNMLLSRTGGLEGRPQEYVLKLGDFGLARMIGPSNLTGSGAPMGTPAYMSPEQIQALELDGRSDLYSLGIVLYEVATGRPPFEIRTVSEAVYKHLYLPPPRLREIRPDLPVELEEIVLRCLAKDPAGRYPTTAELSSALKAFLGSASSHRVGPPQPTSEDRLQQWPVAGTMELAPASGQTPAPVVPASSLASLFPRLRVLDQNGSIVQNLELTREGLTVGRMPTNRVVLSSEVVSRLHLRIDWDGNRVVVTDLDSSNGTMLEGRYLTPNLPEPWAWQESVRVGPFWLQLEQPGAASTAVSERDSWFKHSGSHRVGLALPVEKLAITPGQPVNFDVKVANLGDGPDQLALEVAGVPVSWLKLPAQPVALEPGAQATLTLGLDVPRSAETGSGEYPVSISVRSELRSAESVSSEVRWIVLPFSQENLALAPSTAAGRKQGNYKLMLANEGNTATTYSLAGAKKGQDLALHFEKTEVVLDPGGSTSVRLNVEAPRRWFGRSQQKSFDVQITPSSANSTLSVPAKFVQRPVVPLWLLPVFGVVMLLVLAACITAYITLNATPVIESASWEPLEPLPGQPVTLRWQVRGAQWVEFSPLGVKLEAGRNEYVVADGFAGPTDLTIVASSRFRRVERKLSVKPAGQISIPTPGPGDPLIEEWTVAPLEVMNGQSVLLKWRVRNADSVVLEPFGPVDLVGERQHVPLPPAERYNLIVTKGDRSISRPLEIRVIGPITEAPRIRSFIAEPASLVSGQTGTIRLAWETDLAETVEILPGVGRVDPSGSREIPAPASTMTYTLLARNAAGEATRPIQVEVRELVPTLAPNPPTRTPLAPTAYVPATPTPELPIIAPPTATPELPVALPPTATPELPVYETPSATPFLPTPVPPTATPFPTNTPVPPTPTWTPTPACPGPPTIASFSAVPNPITAGGTSTLNWGAVTNATTVSIDNGIGPVAAPGSVPVSPGATTTYHITAVGCGGSATKEVIVTVNPAIVVPMLTQVSPANGAVLRVFPRVATFNWNPVAVPGGVTYNIEIQVNIGSWQPHANATGLAATNYTLAPFPGDNAGRWRVWATNPTVGDGPKSGWFDFDFNTGASQYSGTWLNDNPATSGITKIIITNVGQTLNVHPYGKCSPTDCDWGTKSAVFDGEPTTITYGGHTITFTLNNAAGTQLKVVDVAASTYTYYFHR